MDILKVTKVGGSLGIALPDDFVAENNLREGDDIRVTRIAGSLLRTPRAQVVEEQMKVARQIMDRYRDVLRTLARS